MSLTDEQVVHRLATRMGYEQLTTTGVRYLRWFTKGGTITMHPQAMLVSLDALQPVLDGLTPEEWNSLINRLEDAFTQSDVIDYDAFARGLLTMPPHTLAHAIAEVLEPVPEHTP